MNTCRVTDSNSRLLFVASLLLVLCLQGCTTVNQRQLPEFDTLSISFLQKPSKGAQATTDRDHQKDALAGGVVGAGAGLAAASFCGPFFVFCAWASVPAGMAVGGAAGYVTGVVIDDNLKDVFGDQFPKLEATLADLKDHRNLSAEILWAVTAATPHNRQVNPDDATALIAVGPKKIELVQFNRTELAVRVTGELVARWDRRRRTNGGYRRLRYVYQTQAFPIEHWLERNGFRLDQAYTDAVTSITTRMIADIR